MDFLSMHTTDSQDCLSLISYRQAVECVPGSACVVVKKDMTNLEHYVISAEETGARLRDDIKLIMADDEWKASWWESKHETLKDWLLAEYKPYKLSQLEYDLLVAVKEWSGGEHTFGSFCILRDLKIKGYYKGIDTQKMVGVVIEQSEVVSDD